eukprot:2033888-Karenia_brevis.AAC.1
MLHLNYGFSKSNGPITVPKIANEMLTMNYTGMTNCNTGMVEFMIMCSFRDGTDKHIQHVSN